MAQTTEIAWCDSTFNPWIGCTKVSPGCAHCYAERDFGLRKHVAKWGAGQPRHRTSAEYWRQPLKWDRAEMGKTGSHAEWVAYRKPRVFCGSLCDWLDDEVPIEWLADLLDLIRRTPSLDWLLLTKRPQNWNERIRLARNHLTMRNAGTALWLNEWLPGTPWYEGCGCAMTASGIIGDKVAMPPANVWIGTTVEDQERADERIPELLKIPARVRFLSCEPLMGGVELGLLGTVAEDITGGAYRMTHEMIHLVICGGESGPHARPMHPVWAGSLRDQCEAAAVPFFFKQWGEWKPIGQMADGESDRYADFARYGKPEPRDEFDRRPAHKNAESTVLQLDGSQRWDFPAGAMMCFRVGRIAAGRLLDGREHNEFPS